MRSSFQEALLVALHFQTSNEFQRAHPPMFTLSARPPGTPKAWDALESEDIQAWKGIHWIHHLLQLPGQMPDLLIHRGPFLRWITRRWKPYIPRSNSSRWSFPRHPKMCMSCPLATWEWGAGCPFDRSLQDDAEVVLWEWRTMSFSNDLAREGI